MNINIRYSNNISITGESKELSSPASLQENSIEIINKIFIMFLIIGSFF